MTTYQRMLRGKITMFAKGVFAKGLASPTLPSDVKTVYIASMCQSKGRVVAAFSLELNDGRRSPHVQVSFPINRPDDWTLHGVYSGGLFDGFVTDDMVVALRQRVS